MGNLPILQIGQPPRLVVDIAHLLISLQIEIPQLATIRGVQRLLKVRVNPAPAARGLGAQLVALVETARAVGCLNLLVEVAERSGEAGGEAVLLVQGNRLLEGRVAQRVSVGEVLGENARPWLILLRDVVVLLLFGRLGGVGCRGDVTEFLGCFDMDDGGA